MRTIKRWIILALLLLLPLAALAEGTDGAWLVMKTQTERDPRVMEMLALAEQRVAERPDENPFDVINEVMDQALAELGDFRTWALADKSAYDDVLAVQHKKHGQPYPYVRNDLPVDGELSMPEALAIAEKRLRERQGITPDVTDEVAVYVYFSDEEFVGRTWYFMFEYELTDQGYEGWTHTTDIQVDAADGRVMSQHQWMF